MSMSIYIASNVIPSFTEYCQNRQNSYLSSF